MRTSTSISILAVVSAVQALPGIASKRQQDNTTAPVVDDMTILNYALTLEHLENSFYKEALAKFDEQAFINAGLPNYARGRFAQVSAHEQAHVDFLTAALGDSATAPCNYSFPYTNPASFAAVSQTLEGVGISAYLGAAALITNKTYLTAAASITSTEARHAAWVQSAVNKQQPWSGPLDVPLTLNQVYSLAAGFIVSCPSTNPPFPVAAFPMLQLAGAPGQTVSVVYDASLTANSTDPLFVSFFSGLSQEHVQVDNGTVRIPDDLRGMAFAFLTRSNETTTDDNIVAGPSILTVNFDSAGNVQEVPVGNASTTS